MQHIRSGETDEPQEPGRGPSLVIPPACIHVTAASHFILQVNNSKLLSDGGPEFVLYTRRGGEWKQSADTAVTLCVSMGPVLAAVAKGEHESLVDFDDHLDDISRDWRCTTHRYTVVSSGPKVHISSIHCTLPLTLNTLTFGGTGIKRFRVLSMHRRLDLTWGPSV
jgi:uncharacterized protein UPF0172